MEFKRKYIAYLDILGFKELVNKNSHEELYRFYNNTISEVIDLSLSMLDLEISANGKNKTYKIKKESIKVNCTTISDSIILWTDDNTIYSFANIIVTVRYFLNLFFKTGIPLRGAIVEGYLDNLHRKIDSSKDTTQSTLIGEGLISAYLKEGKQNWSGCVIDKNCINVFNKQVDNNTLIKLKGLTTDLLLINKLLLKYNVPYKNAEEKKEEIVINWTNIPKDPTIHNEEFIYKQFKEHNKSIEDENVKIKIKNTIDFVNFALNN